MIFTRNKAKDDKPADVKVLRDAIIGFIKTELQKYQGGEGSGVHDITLFMDCSDTEKPLYEAAVYQSEESRFNKDIQKIADDYAIDLPDDWKLQLIFDKLPEGAIKNANSTIGISIKAKENIKKSPIAHTIVERAEIRALNGETAQSSYNINPKSGKINIGRGEVVELSNGSNRTNHISFSTESSNNANKYVSRHHAHIEWNNEKKCFMLYADAGGMPPANKTKVKSASSGQIYKLQVTDIGYALADHDQIILGDSAVLEILYQSPIN